MSGLERTRGVVKFYNGSKGFGFVARDDGQGDVFVHANELKRSGIIEDLQSGDRIEFDIMPVPGKGPKAAEIKVLKVSA